MKLPACFMLSLVLLAFAAFGPLARQPSRAEADGAALGFPAVTCNGGTATVLFNWQPFGGQVQWLDISLADNGFAGGTFIGAMLPGNQAAYQWLGVTAGLPHYWRINTLTSAGWFPSATGVFVPCGGPALLWSPQTCIDRFNATLDFHWAPATAAAGTRVQWLDLGFDENFSPGSFAGAGPLDGGRADYHWTNIQANQWTYFRVNALDNTGVWRTSETGAFYAECAGPVNSDIYGSADRLVAERLGINAGVNVRDVGANGVLGNPAGPTDVVRYNFVTQEGYGGYPGSGGSTMIAGHVDYHDYGLAVFAGLRNVQAGDRIDYYRGDGVLVSYTVDWFADLAPDYNWNSLAIGSNPESIVLITCNGDFNFATREYSHRRVVHATRMN